MNGYPYEDIAAVCWKLNLALQCADKDPVIDEPWDAIPQWRKNICIEAVHLVDTGTIITGQQAHERWRMLMKEYGWNPGAMKDQQAKIHPSLKPWGDLTERQQLGQDFFVMVARRMLFVGS